MLTQLAGLYLSVTKKCIFFIYIVGWLVYVHMYVLYVPYIPMPVARCQLGSCLPRIDFLFWPKVCSSHTPEAIPRLHLIILVGRTGICHANGLSLPKHIIIYHLKLFAHLKIVSSGHRFLRTAVPRLIYSNCKLHSSLGPFRFRFRHGIGNRA